MRHGSPVRGGGRGRGSLRDHDWVDDCRYAPPRCLAAWCMMPGCRAHLLCTCRILRPPRKAGLPRWCRPICSLRMWVLGHDPHAHSRYITPGTHTSQRPIMDNGKWDCYCRPASLSSWQWCDECEALWCMTCWASACTCEMEVERRARAAITQPAAQQEQAVALGRGTRVLDMPGAWGDTETWLLPAI